MLIISLILTTAVKSKAKVHVMRVTGHHRPNMTQPPTASFNCLHKTSEIQNLVNFQFPNISINKICKVVQDLLKFWNTRQRNFL